MPLTPEQVLALRAAVDRIVPADGFPSASELGVVEFLQVLMRKERLEELYSLGLDSLDAESRARFVGGFAELEAEQQDEILANLEMGRTKLEWGVAPQEFFELLARQTIEGYYSDPDNGANWDAAAWQMVGFRVTA